MDTDQYDDMWCEPSDQVGWRDEADGDATAWEAHQHSRKHRYGVQDDKGDEVVSGLCIMWPGCTVVLRKLAPDCPDPAAQSFERPPRQVVARGRRGWRPTGWLSELARHSDPVLCTIRVR
eukprot:106579-Amphidinium_carterae.1